jgi:putative transcriptional regulator
MINLNPPNKLKPQRGRLLISYPLMNDPLFKRTVVLLCEHNEEGSFGFILNKYINVKLSELVKELPDTKGRISMGGPVQTSNLYYMHTLGHEIEGSTEISKGLYLGGHFDALKERMLAGKLTDGEVRFFVGYSGWSENQLDGELKDNAWLISEAPTSLLMNTTDEKLWHKALKDMGKDYSFLAHLPEDPSLN